MKKLFVLLVILIVIAFLWQKAGPYLQNTFLKTSNSSSLDTTVKILHEENLVVDVVKNAGPSVVTVGVVISNTLSPNSLNPFSIFFNEPTPTPEVNTTSKDKFIGSGFVLTKEGFIATNKHVVSDPSESYIVVDSKGKKYKVEKIYRDPLNDLAILKTVSAPAGGFKPVSLGDSSRVEVGQFAIAIGTALGEFRNTVTTGVVSGVGRGITAGSPFEGFAERLDNVIQTDAAINPGNSGGPLLNSSGQVIGINTAVSSQGQNIGFAIPINIVKESLKNFNDTGQFNRPYLGVSYTMLTRHAALLNDLPEGAYVQDVIPDSAADKAGIKRGDIITKFDNQKITDNNGGLAAAISKKKIGEEVSATIYRDGKLDDIKVTLAPAPDGK